MSKFSPLKLLCVKFSQTHNFVFCVNCENITTSKILTFMVYSIYVYIYYISLCIKYMYMYNYVCIFHIIFIVK